jgi:hypothetical protein
MRRTCPRSSVGPVDRCPQALELCHVFVPVDALDHERRPHGVRKGPFERFDDAQRVLPLTEEIERKEEQEVVGKAELCSRCVFEVRKLRPSGTVRTGLSVSAEIARLAKSLPTQISFITSNALCSSPGKRATSPHQSPIE